MDITGFRKKYPMYNHMSDMEVSMRLHKDFYSDMPFQKFREKFGVEAPIEPQATEHRYGPQGLEAEQPPKALGVPPRSPWEIPGPESVAERYAKGSIEAGAGLATGIPTFVAGQLARIPDAPARVAAGASPAEAILDSEKIAEAIAGVAYQPRSREGRKITETLLYPVTEVREKGIPFALTSPTPEERAEQMVRETHPIQNIRSGYQPVETPTEFKLPDVRSAEYEKEAKRTRITQSIYDFILGALPAAKGFRGARKRKPVPQKLSEAVEKPTQPQVLERMGVKGEAEQIKQIVNDEVGAKVKAAAAFEKRGDKAEAARLRAEAEASGKKLMEADGELTEAEVKAALAPPTAKQPQISVKGKIAQKRILGEEGAVRIGPERKLTEHMRERADADPGVGKTQRVFEEQRRAQEAHLKKPWKKRAAEIKRALVDVGSTSKDALLARGGEAGRKAARQHDLIAGASSRARFEFDRATKKLYKDFTKEEYEFFNDFIQGRRAQAITKYKGEKFKHAGGIKAEEYAKWEASLPEATRKKFEERAKVYFDTMREQVDKLRDAKIITKEQHKALVEKGDYSPRKVMKYIDPEAGTQRGFGGTISVSESGIKSLKEGDYGMLENDSAHLLNEVISRTGQRIARNDANLELYRLAKDNPKNGIVEIERKLKVKKKPKPGALALEKMGVVEKAEAGLKDVKKKLPADKARINVMVDGKPVSMITSSEFAKSWVTSEPAVSKNVANTLQWISGTKILKPMATGLNPEFALTNLPRDMAHIWLTTSEYSTLAPKALAQMGRDMAAVFLDAARKTGRYEQYIKEGGGMDFLTHQGRAFRSDTMLGQVQSVLGYLGETSEILMRLALRERALRNGKSPLDATHAARNYLDFSQGGYLSKALDNAVPYLNASIQGTRGIFRAAKTNPKQFMAKTAQVMAFATGLYYANKHMNPEAYSQVPEREKVNNFIITTPFSYKDKEGNTRWIYFKIAKDQGQRIFTSIAETLAMKFAGEDVDEEQITQAIKDFLPLMPETLLPPTLEASLGYMSNKDFWRNEDIWRQQYTGPVDPKEEYTNYTHPAFVKLGEVTGLSPERSRYFLSQYFTSGNIYTSLVGYAFKEALKDMPQSEKQKVTQEIILGKPFVRRVARSTHPYYATEKQTRKAKQESATKRLKENRELDRLSQDYIDEKGTIKDVTDYIKSFKDRDTKKRLYQRHRRRKMLATVPNRRWWLDVAELEPEARAVAFHKKYTEADEAEKKELMKNMNRVPGMRSERFMRQLYLLKKARNE